MLCKLIQLINFPEIDPRDNSVDAEMRYLISGEEFYAIKDKTVGPFTPDLIVRLGTRPVQTYLDVEQIHRLQFLHKPFVQYRSVCAYTGCDAFAVGVIKNIEKIFAQKRFPAAEIDLKDLQSVQLVDQPHTLAEIELFMQVFSNVCRETVGARKIT